VPAERTAALDDVHLDGASTASPRSSEILFLAMIGNFRLLQISAESGRTSATAQLVSSGEPLRKLNVKVCSTTWAPGGAGVRGFSAATSWSRTVALDAVSTVPVPQSTAQAAHGVDALAEGDRPHGHAGGDRRHVVTPGMPSPGRGSSPTSRCP